MRSSPQPLRFLCDEMLHRLGRWLRGAGYDTLIAPEGMDDAALLALALAESRLMLTRDRAILQRRRAVEVVVLVDGDSVHHQAHSLTRAVGVDWLADPFSRCLVCNTPLVTEPPAGFAERVPPSVLQAGLPIHHCPGCDRLYWPGSHERRMRRTLESFRLPPAET